jgi:hypothetical protein
MSTTDSEKKVDHLAVDAPVPGQNYVCLSFVSPDKVLKQKDEFLMHEFWRYLRANSMGEDARFDLSIMENVGDAHATFMHEKGTDLEEQFHQNNAFQTTVRGLKVRGVYNTMEEATVRSKVLQRLDKSHHVFVAPVGYWVPWDPNADMIAAQEYQEEQLNELMKNYKENEVKRDIYYEEEKNKMKDEAIQQNMERKAKLAGQEDEAAGGDSTSSVVVEDGPGAASLADSLDSAKPHTDLASDFEKFKKTM